MHASYFRKLLCRHNLTLCILRMLVPHNTGQKTNATTDPCSAMLHRIDNNSWTRVPNTKEWLRNSTRMAGADRTQTQCPDKNIARAATTSQLYS